MSATNGGRGTPPIPPPEALPQQQEIPLQAEITRRPAGPTTAERRGDGLAVSFIVLIGGQPEQHTYLVGEPGKKALLDAITGGLEVAQTVPPGGGGI
jgi:hypothetical protein